MSRPHLALHLSRLRGVAAGALTTGALAHGAAAVALLAAAAPAAGAQAVLGVGDDALVLPRGVFRLRVLGQQATFDERYGSISTSGIRPDRREPLMQDLNIQSIGTTQFPNLRPVEQGLRALTGINDFALSLGRTTATGEARINAGSLVAELAATRRLSFGVVVPFVDTRTVTDLQVNPNREGNVGFNPAAAGIAAARQQNTALVGQLLGAARAVEQAVGLQPGACATSSVAQCAAVNGVRTFAGGIGAIYGADAIAAAGYPGAAGSPFVPLGSSAAQQAIVQRIAGIRAQLGAAGAGITATAPFAAPQNLQLADAQRILTEAPFGVRAAPVGTSTRRGLGDIEIAGKYALFNSFGHTDPNARLNPTGLHLRSSVTGVVRVGTGLAENPSDFLDVPTGTGAHALGVRFNNDVVLGRRLWGTLALRYTAQIEDNQVVRIIDQPERVLAASYREQMVRRDLGDFFEVEATPRVILTDWLALAGQYYYRNKGEDVYTGSFDIPVAVTGFGTQPLRIDARTLSAETEAREHRVGGGFSLSSVKAFTEGRFAVPAELTYTLQQTVDGFGGAVSRLTLHQLQVRLYARFWGQ